VCLQSLDDRIKALEAQVDSLCASASSSDDRVANLITKYKAVQAAVHVRMSTCAHLYFLLMFKNFIVSELAMSLVEIGRSSARILIGIALLSETGLSHIYQRQNNAVVVLSHM